ncbi:hypothetical protein [Alloactinosynnema sp. L-07]|nr:hypothetical protein [Alloactinosynnema sp. L-07]
MIVDLDASLLDAHSEKENAAPTFMKGFGFHPLCRGAGGVAAVVVHRERRLGRAQGAHPRRR